MTGDDRLYIETRNDRRGVFFAVACPFCDWWDDENDSYLEAEKTGERHIEQKHPGQKS